MKFTHALTTLIALTAFAAVPAIAQQANKMAPAQMKSKRKPMPMKNGKVDWATAYRQAERMFETKDADALMAYMAPDCTMTSMGRTQKRDEALAGLKQWFAMTNKIDADMKVVKVEEKGNTAIVHTVFKMTGWTKPTPQDKKAHTIVQTGSEAATWAKSAGNVWMLKKIVATNEKMTMDGKPFDPNKAGG